eukprot:g4008.t1
MDISYVRRSTTIFGTVRLSFHVVVVGVLLVLTILQQHVHVVGGVENGDGFVEEENRAAELVDLLKFEKSSSSSMRTKEAVARIAFRNGVEASSRQSYDIQNSVLDDNVEEEDGQPLHFRFESSKKRLGDGDSGIFSGVSKAIGGLFGGKKKKKSLGGSLAFKMPEDPCEPFIDSNTGKLKAPKGCDPIPVMCPGEMKRGSKDEYFVGGKFRKKKSDEVIETCSGHGRATRTMDPPDCACTCDQGWGGGFPMKDCSKRWEDNVVASIDCNNIPDSYLVECNSVATTVCNPYSLTWRFECARTCRAVIGKSCKREEIARHCMHDPECPLMCFKMMQMSCEEQVLKYRWSIDPKLKAEATRIAKEQETDGPESSSGVDNTDSESKCEGKSEEECKEPCEYDRTMNECIG